MNHNNRSNFTNLLDLSFLTDGNSRCETAYLTIKCYFETAPDVNNQIISILNLFSNIFFPIFSKGIRATMRRYPNDGVIKINQLS